MAPIVQMLKDMRDLRDSLQHSLVAVDNVAIQRRVEELTMQINAVDMLHRAYEKWVPVGEFVQNNPDRLNAVPGDWHADILLRELPAMLADAERYRALRSFAMETDPAKGEAIDAALTQTFSNAGDRLATYAEFDAIVDGAIEAAREVTSP